MAKRTEKPLLPDGWTWEQAADWLGVSVRTLHDLANRGEIETYSLGPRIARVKPESCLRLRDKGLNVKSIRPPRGAEKGEAR